MAQVVTDEVPAELRLLRPAEPGFEVVRHAGDELAGDALLWDSADEALTRAGDHLRVILAQAKSAG